LYKSSNKTSYWLKYNKINQAIYFILKYQIKEQNNEILYLYNLNGMTQKPL
jgi:hypothetical protein